MSGLLAGETAIVTGAAQGIGLATARLLSIHGANVAVLDVDGDGAQRIANDLPGPAAGYGCDVTNLAAVEESFDLVGSQLGRVGIVVNNAGITRDATLGKMTEADFDEVVKVNLKGVWIGTKVASSAMRETGGSIVNMSSISGKVGFFGQTNYSATKAGVVGMTKAAAKELARFGIRVNAIQPGLIESPMTAVLSSEIFAQKLSEIPLGRAGQPEDVANAVLFLASPMSSYITGSVLEVTGGRYM